MKGKKLKRKPEVYAIMLGNEVVELFATDSGHDELSEYMEGLYATHYERATQSHINQVNRRRYLQLLPIQNQLRNS